MMMMAVVGGWCFLVGAMQSAPDKERLLCIFNFSPRQQVQGFTGVHQGNVFSSLKERNDALPRPHSFFTLTYLEMDCCNKSFARIIFQKSIPLKLKRKVALSILLHI